MNIIIFALGCFTELMKTLFLQDSERSIVGFCAEKFFIDQPAFGLPVFSFEDICTTHPPEDFGMFVAVGYSKNEK